jgi:thiaminase
MSETAESLYGAHEELWVDLVGHPFVVAAGDGSLPNEVFDRWLVADHWYLAVLRRFIGGLVVIAPDEYARDVLGGAFAPLQELLDEFRQEAAARGLDLDDEPGPVTLGYTSYLLSTLHDGYEVAATALYAAEKAHLDAWSTVRGRTRAGSPYWTFIESWTSPGYSAWVEALDALLGRAAVDAPTGAMYSAFGRVVRFELDFWDAVHTGEGW